jgi:hypothetical protein
MNYTVLSTSGWRADSWRVAGFCDSLKQAKDLRSKIQTPHARHDGYIIRIVRGWGKICDKHDGLCVIFNLRPRRGERRGERHLEGCVHASCNAIGIS